MSNCKDEFFRPGRVGHGRVCVLLVGPLPGGVTHSCERVAARSAAGPAPAVGRPARSVGGEMSAHRVLTGV